MKGKKSLSVKTDEETYATLRSLALKEERTITAILSRAVKKYKNG